MNIQSSSSSLLLLLRQEKILLLLAALASLLLSAWIEGREAVVNTDAICYLLSAEQISKGGFVSAMHLCDQAKWPFYSLLIYIVQNLFHISAQLSAYILDAIFSLITVLSFILIVRTLGGSFRTMVFASLIILLSHTFNSVREYIIRDHGFWAFYLLSILLLLTFMQQPRLRLALLWSASLIIAALFRIEGAVFLLLLPIINSLRLDLSWRMRITQFLQLQSCTLLIMLGLGCWLLMHPQTSLNKLGRIPELLQQAQHGLELAFSRYQTTKAALLQYVLSAESQHDATTVSIIFYLGWYTVHLLSNLSWIYVLLLVYAFHQHCLRMNSTTRLIIFGYLIINIGVTLSFLMQHHFLSKRYLLALTLTLMLWIPFALDRLWERANLSRQEFVLALCSMIAVVIASLGGLFEFGYSKAYIHQAGTWLAQNVPSDAKLYVNDMQVMYYSQHFGTDLFQCNQAYEPITHIAQGQWKAYDYVALRLDRKSERDQTLLKQLALQPQRVFSNRRGDQVVIYKLRSH